MAVPIARVHLKMAHAALPPLLSTPPNNWKMLPLLPTTPYVVAAIVPKPLAKPGRADADEKWDARKIKSARAAEPSSSSASGLRSAADGVVRSTGGQGSSHSQRKNATSPSRPPMPGRADAVERWDAHKKAAASLASSSSSSGTSSLASSSKWAISRATSAERWDVNKKPRPSQANQRLDDGESSSTGSTDIDMEEEEEEILWKPRAMYAGPGFAVAAPESSMLPMPTMLAVRVA